MTRRGGEDESKAVRVRKAVLPAAGFGTRFLPATKAIPKELVSIVDKPMIQYAAEEAVGAGIRSIALVTSPWKTAIARHFGRSPELEAFLSSRGKAGLLAELAAIGRPADFTEILQPEQLGLGQAVSLAEDFAAGEPVAVLNPDTIYDGPVPCIRQLIDVFEERRATVVVLGRISREATWKHAVVKARPVGGRVFELLDMAEKPGPDAAYSDLAILGRYVLTPGIFGALRKTPPGTGGEIQITDAIKVLSETEPVFGVLFEGTRFDAGDKFGFLEATLHFALKRPEFADRLGELLKTLL